MRQRKCEPCKAHLRRQPFPANTFETPSKLQKEPALSGLIPGISFIDSERYPKREENEPRLNVQAGGGRPPVRAEMAIAAFEQALPHRFASRRPPLALS